jgi:hypothetical protein
MQNQKIENPQPEEKVCFNCKHMSWLVALGQGIRCTVDKKEGEIPTMVSSRWYTCNKFEKKLIISNKI